MTNSVGEVIEYVLSVSESLLGSFFESFNSFIRVLYSFALKVHAGKVVSNSGTTLFGCAAI